MCLLVLCPLLVACGKEDAKSPYAVSINQPSSALQFPAMIEGVNKQIRDREAKAKENIAKIPSAADKLADTDWDLVAKIADAADASGMDGGYAAELHKLEGVRDFMDDEREEIVKKIGGAVQYAAKQKNCDVDAWGAISASLKDVVDDRMKERMRANNEALLLIERHEDTLGKKNVPALEDMADLIAFTSYTTHVELPEAKERLEELKKSSAQAKSALERLIKEETEHLTPDKKPEIAKASKVRIKGAEEKIAAIDAATADTDQNLADVEQRAKDLQKSYDDAKKQLGEAISAKKSK